MALTLTGHCSEICADQFNWKGVSPGKTGLLASIGGEMSQIFFMRRKDSAMTKLWCRLYPTDAQFSLLSRQLDFVVNLQS
jgi:hypothetical protein